MCSCNALWRDGADEEALQRTDCTAARAAMHAKNAQHTSPSASSYYMRIVKICKKCHKSLTLKQVMEAKYGAPVYSLQPPMVATLPDIPLDSSPAELWGKGCIQLTVSKHACRPMLLWAT